MLVLLENYFLAFSNGFICIKIIVDCRIKMSKKDEVKSLVNSVNMVKNMVESIVAAVQERFKDYDNAVVTLKERIEKLENQTSGTVQDTTTQALPTDLFAKFEMLEKRMDSLNERLLLIEATKSVHEEPIVEAADVQVLKEIAERETKVETELLPEAPKTPAPTPRLPEIEPEAETEVPSTPGVEAPTLPPPTPPAIPEIILEPTTEVAEEEIIEQPQTAPTAEVTEIPTAPAIPKPATQISDAVERDVSPISKEVVGTIPMPPKQEDAVLKDEEIQPPVPKTETEDTTPPEEGKSAELFGEAVSGDKAELLKALKKLEDL